MRIDAHHHFWKFDSQQHAWINDEMKKIQRDFLPDDLSPVLKTNLFDGCITVQVEQTEEENKFLLSVAERNSIVKGIVGWIDLKGNNLDERLEYYKQFPILKGFRHIVQGEPTGFLTDGKFIEGVNKLSSYGFTYDLLIYHYQLPEALEFVMQVPDVKIVVDHIAKPSIRTGEKTHWELNMAALSTFPNVFCKISGMVTEANWTGWKNDDFYPYMDEVFESFGANRILYGSDWPVCLVAATYEQQLEIVTTYIQSLSVNEQDQIMGRNAVNFYNL
jgi:L-fuconolactonase